MKIWRMRSSCWIPKAKTHTFRICNTSCFSTTTMFLHTSFIVVLYKYRLPYFWPPLILLPFLKIKYYIFSGKWMWRRLFWIYDKNLDCTVLKFLIMHAHMFKNLEGVNGVYPQVYYYAGFIRLLRFFQNTPSIPVNTVGQYLCNNLYSSGYIFVRFFYRFKNTCQIISSRHPHLIKVKRHQVNSAHVSY
jgi:hypothetical protein